MGSWRGRLFGPGQAAAGSEVEVTLDFGALLLRVPGEPPRQVAVSELALRYTGFNNRHLELAWQGSDGAWACHLDRPAEMAALLAAWPAERVPLPASVAGAPRHATLPWAALALFIALPVVLLVTFVLSQERVVDFIARQISPEVERQIGAATLAQLKLTTRFVEQGAEAQALARVAHALTVGAAGTYRFHLADDKLINAFALPGGDIVVNRGLIAATHDAGELAGVLAHEIQHVALRHSLKGMIRSAGMSLLFSMLVGDLGTTLVGHAAENLAGLKFSRDAENEADVEGFNLLVARGIDPRGMMRFFATLAGASGATPPALLSTHPASAEREAALAARVKALPADCCQPLQVAGGWPPPM